uniref:Tyr recombinase domain-containing protein n=1 Tax=Uncultured marine euryarchaeote TaxID=257466 RepID=A0A1B0Z1X4_UNCAR|nr:hypothetical protein [uncultured marine euryarchaeote]
MAEHIVKLSERTHEHREQLLEYQSQTDVSTASMGEIATDFTRSQVEEWQITEKSGQGKISAFNRWQMVFEEAGIDTPADLRDRARRANFCEVFNTNLEDGRFQQTYALKRQMELLKEMLTIAQIPKGIINKLMTGVEAIVKSFKIQKTHTTPYSAEQTKLVLSALDEWVADPSKAPSLTKDAGTKHGGTKAIRAPSEASLKRLRALTTISAIANCRISGLKTIKLEDVDLENKELSYHVTKARVFTEECKVRIPDWAIPAIASWVSFLTENRPNATHLCCGDNGNAGVVADSTLTRPLRNMMKHLDIVTTQNAGYHRFRASVASSALKAGEAPSRVAMALNHQDGGQLSTQYGQSATQVASNEVRSHWLDDIRPDIENIPDALTVEVPEWEVLPSDIKLMSNLRAIATGMLSNAFGDDYQRNPDADNPDINPYTDADLQAPAPSLNKCTYENGKLVSRDAVTGTITHEMVTELSQTQPSLVNPQVAGSNPAHGAKLNRVCRLLGLVQFC